MVLGLTSCILFHDWILQPATWLKLKERLMPDGRFMVNCGGIGEASEKSQPESVDDTWVQNSTIKALSESFPGAVWFR